MHAPDGFQPNVTAVPVHSKGELARIRIKTADGRVFDLGKPTSVFYPLRLALYKWKRRNELKGAKA